jgi:hypothetical protein
MADRAGPVTIDTELLRSAGKVTVRVDPTCKQASIVVSTPDAEGPSAEAVQRATMTQNRDGVMSAKVAGTSRGGTTISGNGMVIQTGGRGISFGGGNDIQISGFSGPITVNGVQINGPGSGIPTVSPIEVTAVVPPGSALIARTESADIQADGLRVVDAQTQSGSVDVPAAWSVNASAQSGDVSVGWVQDLDAKTQSGNVSVGWAQGQVSAKAQSGNVNVRQFAGQTAQVNSMSGNARIHVVAQPADAPQAGEQRMVRASAMSGNAHVTAENAQVEQNLNAQASSMSGRSSAPQPAATRPLHEDGARQYNTQMPGRASRESQGY